MAITNAAASSTLTCTSAFNSQTTACAAGFIKVDGPADACTESKCATYSFGAGLVAGDSDGCFAGIELTAHTDPSCTVKCDSGSGYGTQAGTIACANNANKGESDSAPMLLPKLSDTCA